MGVWQPYRDKCSSMTKVYPKPQSEGQFLTKSIQHVFVVGPQEEDQREVAFFEKVHMCSSVGEDRPSDAGGPRFDSQCPLLRQIHVIDEVFVTCS